MDLQPLWTLASFSVSWSIHNLQHSLNEWSAHRKASTQTLDGKWSIILLRGPLGAWGSLSCSKFTTRVKQLKVPPGGLVPWIFPSLRSRRLPPGLNPRRSSHEVGTLPLDYGGRCMKQLVANNIKKVSNKQKLWKTNVPQPTTNTNIASGITLKNIKQKLNQDQIIVTKTNKAIPLS
jgi:hypothetical protein